MMNTRTMRGFTLVETLVAITIIATALVGPFYAVQQALNASRNARDQLIATSLAQEGVEYVRSIRDSNYLYNNVNVTPRSWLYRLDGTGGSDCLDTAGGCVVDPAKDRVSTSITSLYLNSDDVYNQQGEGTPTVFRRTVRLTTVTVTEVLVTVTVDWTTKGQARSSTVSETLNNWL